MYHAHDNLRDNHVDTFSQKIADKIADNVPGTILVTLDSKKLSLNIDTHALIVQQHDANSGELIHDCRTGETTFVIREKGFPEQIVIFLSSSMNH